MCAGYKTFGRILERGSMHKVYRDAEAELARANEILKAQLTPELKTELLPVISPGRASLVNALFENFGYRGDRLDPRTFERYWTVLAEGSSLFSHPALNITADELSTIVQVITRGFDRFDEIPGGEASLTERCVVIKKKLEVVEYYGVPVQLDPQHLKLIYFLLKWARQQEGGAPDIKVYEELGSTPDLVEVMSRIRRSFRDATAHLDAERQKLATLLVKKLFPDRGAVGYRIGLPELFVIVDC